MSEKTVRFKKNHSKTEDNIKGCEGNRNNKKNNKNYINGNQNYFAKNNVQEVISYLPKLRKTKGSKKTIEATNPYGENDVLKATRLDDGSTLQETIDTAHELNIFCEENDSCRDYEYNAANMNEQELEEKIKALEKTVNTAFKH